MIVGIDVSKDKLDIHVLNVNKHFVIKNTHASITSFFKNKLQCEATLVVFEATGGYERLLHRFMIQQNIPYHRAHPNRVYSYAKSEGYFAKTDRIDARILARFGDEKKIKPSLPTTVEQLAIQDYSARRSQLKNMISAEKQRLSAFTACGEIKRSIVRNIKQLERELTFMTEKLNQLIKADEELDHKQQLLKTVKGVGEEVAITLITELPELGRLSREEISHLVGVAPQTKESGKKKGYRATSQGRREVRRILYMAALAASRFNPRMKMIYQKLLAKGKLKKVALVAIMRKMIIMLNAMVKTGEPWQCERI